MRMMLKLSLIVLCLAGCIISGVLIWLSANVGTSSSILGMPLCGAGARINCDAVLSSEWAHVGVIPLAHFGFMYFVSLAAWFIVIGLPNREGRYWHLVPLAMVLIGACTSAWLTYVMIARLPLLCTWCLAAHIVNGLLLIFVVLSWPKRQSAQTAIVASPAVSSGDTSGIPKTHPVVAIPRNAPYPSAMQAGTTLAATVIGTVLFTLVGLVYIHYNSAAQCQRVYRETTNNIDYLVWRWQAAPQQEISIRTDDFAFGRPDAPHTLVIFSDFECGRCAEFFGQAERLVSQFPTQLRCVFKHFPLSTACNPHVARTIHYHACEAALAATAAETIASKTQLRQYYGLLYMNSHRLAEQPYDEWARQVGLDAPSFAKAMTSSAVGDRLREDIELAHRLGVDGTPTMFLDGRRMSNWRIVTEETLPRMDVNKTVSLWEHLLDARATINRKSEPRP